MSDLGSVEPLADEEEREVDLVLPFLLEIPNVRGRLVRLGPSVDAILTRHAYPEPVARLLGEMLVLAGLLSSLLKFEGVFTLQTKGDGPVPFLVTDVTDSGHLRGYAEFDPAGVEAALEAPLAPGEGAIGRLLGKGYIALTVDQGPETERYQGIVELMGDRLSESLQHYFRQSEQLKTGFTVALERDSAGHWGGAGLLIQRIPGEGEQTSTPGSAEEDDWRRVLVLLSTLSNRELLDVGLTANRLLYRLFHEERVRVYERRAVEERCRCSRERIEDVLTTMAPEALDDLQEEDGAVVVTCQFCSRSYRFERGQLADAARDRHD